MSGLRARGGLEVAMTWADGKLVQATLKPSRDIPLKVRYAGKETEFQAKSGRTITFGPRP